MKICYVDHSFHQKTLSTQFVAEILRKQGIEVEFVWDNAWQGGTPVNLDELIGSYDAFIFFQLAATSSRPYYKLPVNITFIPMLDSFGNDRTLHFHRDYWKTFAGVKFLNFSRALDCAASSHGLASRYFQYFPDPACYEPTHNGDGLKGFLWQRLPTEVNWDIVKTVTTGTAFDSFHLHMAVDPFHTQVYPSKSEQEKYRLTLTDWFEDRAEYYQKVAETRVYFTPRPSEGIGMSFLEAMAMGKCVVSPDFGTMNDYIMHGVNGLLYDFHRPQPLDFSRVGQLGAMARESIERGFETWEKREAELVEYILTPPDKIYNRLYPMGIDCAALAGAESAGPSLGMRCRSWLLRLKQKVGRSRLRPILHPIWRRIKARVGPF
jgi:hypothetical protein